MGELTKLFLLGIILLYLAPPTTTTSPQTRAKAQRTAAWKGDDSRWEMESGTALQLKDRRYKGLITRPIHPKIVIYNRVPKAASATLLRICNKLSKRNKFSYNNMLQVGRSETTRTRKMKLGKWIFGRPMHKKHFFFRHMSFVNFTKLNLGQPTWINVVRHPVQRYISHYYYKRPLQSLPVCIHTGRCRFKRGGSVIKDQLYYFYGYKNKDNRKKLKSEMLRIAKGRVEKAFAVVGLKEHFDSTLYVLEHVLPGYFSGVSRMKYENWNVRTTRPPTSNRTMTALRRRLSADIEFYEFLKQRFFRQLWVIKWLNQERAGGKKRS